MPKTIVITGASDGIGAAAARQLHADGHHVVVVGRSAAKTQAVAREIGADHLIYEEVADMESAIVEGSDVEGLEMSCFTGEYVTGTVDAEYLKWVEANQLS